MQIIEKLHAVYSLRFTSLILVYLSMKYFTQKKCISPLLGKIPLIKALLLQSESD